MQITHKISTQLLVELEVVSVSKAKHFKYIVLTKILLWSWFLQNYGYPQTWDFSNISKVSKVGDHSRGWPEGSLSDSLLHQGVGEGATPFPGLLHFTLDPYLIMLSVKQGGIKYHFLSLWYDSTWEWTQVSRTIGEHSNRLANVRLI